MTTMFVAYFGVLAVIFCIVIVAYTLYYELSHENHLKLDTNYEPNDYLIPKYNNVWSYTESIQYKKKINKKFKRIPNYINSYRKEFKCRNPKIF